ncbi:hypothetical protein JCM8547_002454 [Rhodosporidiobolus lusitaniae]
MNDQYTEVLSQQQPALHFKPPSPVSASTSYPASSFMIPSSSHQSTASIPLPIPVGSRPTSRAGTPSLSRSNSFRHHPYGGSPASSDRPFRPRSATSVSDRSEWETDADSHSVYGSSIDSYSFTPSSSYGASFPSFPTANSPFVSGPASPGKTGKSHARKTAPGHIKRPPNAFILFRSHCCQTGADAEPTGLEPPGTVQARQLAALEINNSQHISIVVSQVWKGLSPEGRAYWQEKAAEAKAEHARLHPDYRYRPMQRPKEQIRRRKRTDIKATESERNACPAVAEQLLELDRSSREQSQSFYDSGADLAVPATLSAGLDGAAAQWPAVGETYPVPAPKAPAPKKKRVRKPAASKKTKKATLSPDGGMFNLELAEQELPTSTFNTPATFNAYQSGGYTPSSLADFSGSMADPFVSYGRRISHTRATQAYGSPEAAQQFGYMAQLNNELPPVSAINPQLAALDLSRPHTGVSPPSAIDPSFNIFTPTSALPESPTVFALPHPPSPQTAAIAQMQHYTMGGTPFTPSILQQQPDPLPVPPALSVLPSPTGTTFAFGTAGAGFSEGAPHRRAATAPVPPPLDALQRRRDTLRPNGIAAGSADIMLVSLMTTDFNDRKQSLGTWSARRLSLNPAPEANPASTPKPPFARSALATGVLSANEEFETLTFSPEVLNALPAEDATGDFVSQFASFQNDYEDVETRPSTASSEWSTDGEVERLEAELPLGYLGRRRSTIVPSKFGSAFSTAPTSASGSPAFSGLPYSAPATHSGFHVGSTDFFTRPEPPLASASPTTSAFSTGSPRPFEQSVVPPFGSAGFGGSFRPFVSRPSVDAILPATSPSTFLPPPRAPPAGDHPSPDVPINVTGGEEDWTGQRDAALNVLYERRQQREYEAHYGPSQHSQSPSLDAPATKQEGERKSSQCEHGFGVAFAIASPPTASPPAFSPQHLPSSEPPSYAGSPLAAHSSTF